MDRGTVDGRPRTRPLTLVHACAVTLTTTPTQPPRSTCNKLPFHFPSSSIRPTLSLPILAVHPTTSIKRTAVVERVAPSPFLPFQHPQLPPAYSLSLSLSDHPQSVTARESLPLPTHTSPTTRRHSLNLDSLTSLLCHHAYPLSPICANYLTTNTAHDSLSLHFVISERAPRALLSKW